MLQARPFLSYVVLGLNLSVYAAGLAVRFSMGESSGEDYFYILAKVNDGVTHGEYYRSGSSSMLCARLPGVSCHTSPSVV